MRIVGGKLRGRNLATPSDEAIRPTSDRVREAVFNWLLHGDPVARIDGGRVIDLVAGTGAMGIEALSRGAAFCLFVEEAAEARGLIRRNIEAFGLTGVTKVWRRDATDLGPAGNMQPYDVAFLDPPYGKGLGEKALAALADGGWLVPGALCVLEERKGVNIAVPDLYDVVDQRTWGDTQAVMLRFRGT
ncbi:MAG TPA: 16S rRNA (guanine(966)-N(2))-methyltransferase RsmD [Hyphomicrobiaceae bacterium]|nr:16S rRNA (guanine(966)-N(2))-methyltransferase RsmD [Hyphomicrobiaceae bacterium]